MSHGPTGEVRLKLERDWGSHVNKDDEMIYEDKREKLTKQQFWALRYKKGTDRGKRRLKYTDLVKDGLKNGYFIVFLILIWATLSSSTGESGVEIYWF